MQCLVEMSIWAITQVGKICTQKPNKTLIEYHYYWYYSKRISKGDMSVDS